MTEEVLEVGAFLESVSFTEVETPKRGKRRQKKTTTIVTTEQEITITKPANAIQYTVDGDSWERDVYFLASLNRYAKTHENAQVCSSPKANEPNSLL